MSERSCCVLSHEGENTIYGLQFSVTKLICLCAVLFYSNGISFTYTHTNTNLFRLTCANQFFEKQKLKSFQFEGEREVIFWVCKWILLASLVEGTVGVLKKQNWKQKEEERKKRDIKWKKKGERIF